MKRILLHVDPSTSNIYGTRFGLPYHHASATNIQQLQITNFLKSTVPCRHVFSRRFGYISFSVQNLDVKQTSIGVLKVDVKQQQMKPFINICSFSSSSIQESDYENFLMKNLSNNFPIKNGKNSKKTESNQKRQLSQLEKNTLDILKSPEGSWKRKDISIVRSLLEQWLSQNKEENPQKFDIIVVAKSSSQLLQRWLREYSSGNEIIIKRDNANTPSSNNDEVLIVYVLRILKAWRICMELDSKQTEYNFYKKNNKQWQRSEMTHSGKQLSEPTDTSLYLLQRFYETSLEMKAGNPRLLSTRAYTMTLHLLSLEIKLNPSNAHFCLDKADEILEQILSTNFIDVTLVNQYLHVLAESSPFIQDSPEKAEQFLLKSNSNLSLINKFKPNSKSYATVLHAWANSPRVDAPERALLLLDKFQTAAATTKEISVDTVPYNICIRAVAKAGKAQLGEDLLWKMHHEFVNNNNTSVQPDHTTFLAAIDGWSKSKNPERAKQLLDQMISLHENHPLYTDTLQPTSNVYTTVMNSYAHHQVNPGPQVEALLRRMENASLKSHHNSCKPTLWSYTVAVRAWALTNHSDSLTRAEAIVKQMEENGKTDNTLKPNTITYTALIHAFQTSLHEDAPQRALFLLRKMQNISHRDVAPNTFTYNKVMGAFARRGMACEAHELLNEMLDNLSDQSVVPDAYSWAIVIEAYAKSRRADAGECGYKLLLDMEKWLDENGEYYIETSYPTALPYVFAVEALERCGNFEEAESVLWHMTKRFEELGGKTKNFMQPNNFVCNAVLKAWSNSEEPMAPDRAQFIWRWMNDQVKIGRLTNIKPNADTIKHIIRVWEQSERLSAKEWISKIRQEVKLKYPALFKYTI